MLFGMYIALMRRRHFTVGCALKNAFIIQRISRADISKIFETASILIWIFCSGERNVSCIRLFFSTSAAAPCYGMILLKNVDLDIIFIIIKVVIKMLYSVEMSIYISAKEKKLMSL